ncbi:MAG TPA: hypothetical protein VF483_10315 [Gemmatimonadaceae bacterium]
MNARIVVAVALVASAMQLNAQSWRESSVRIAPQSYSFSIKTPINEKVSETAIPLYVTVPVMPSLRIDIGTAFATANFSRQVPDSTGGTFSTTTSKLSGLTDTQIRVNYSLGEDLVVFTAGLNLPTGSATVRPDELDAATRIGSDFLSFPISGFGSGMGMTGGVAVSKPAGDWNLGFAASMRYASQYEPFKDAAGVATKFQPGAEIRTRVGLDHPLGDGRISFGLTYSKFGDDKANSATFNTGDRFIGQVVVNNAFQNGVDYTVAFWNLYRTSGTLINGSVSPSANISNALMAFGLRGPAGINVEPSVEARVFTQQGAQTSFLTNVGMRFVYNRGPWAVVPGFGFSVGQLETATVTGFHSTLAVRVGY